MNSIQIKHLVSISVLTFAGLLPFEAAAQADSVASGGDALGSGGSVSYSIGQNFYQTVGSTSGYISQGVQHQYEFSALDVIDPNVRMSLMAYPNPVSDVLHLVIEDVVHADFSFKVLTITGTLICEGKASTSDTVINMQMLPTATYILHVSKNSKRCTSFKIIKK